MDPVHAFLADIWFWLIGLMLVLYVVLDGFDLGVGIFSLFAGDEERRSVMMVSLGSVWDANETWLVLLGGALFGAFPLAYGIVLHAMYLPLTLMIFGLILRGVAFEFREHARKKLPWNLSFGGGSLLAAASQGLILGALVRGIRVQDGAFAGGPWDWFSPFSVLTAAGVVAGYTLLGATYLVIKTDGEVQKRSAQLARIAAAVMLAAAGAVTIWTPFLHPEVARKWFGLPSFFYFAPLPAVALFAFWMILRALRRGYEHAPFFWTLVIFLASFAGLAASLYPDIIPHAVTVQEAATSSKTLVFMLTGIGMLVPVMLIYNGYQYLVFRGKVQRGGYGDEA
jgi:cytochrome bd ubiquinol oxidase subunit II